MHGGRARLHAPDGPLFVGNSGTTVRFLAAIAALVDGEVTWSATTRGEAADPGAGRRVARAGRRCHVRDGLPAVDDPWRTAARRPRPHARRSIEPVLLGAADGGRLRRRRSRCRDRRLAGQPALRRHHAPDDRRFRRRRRGDAGGLPHPTPGARCAVAITPSSPTRPRPAIPFALAAALGGAVVVPGLGRDAQQGDYAFTAILEEAGARVTRGETSTRVERLGALRGVDVDMHQQYGACGRLRCRSVLLRPVHPVRRQCTLEHRQCGRGLRGIVIQQADLHLERIWQHRVGYPSHAQQRKGLREHRHRFSGTLHEHYWLAKHRQWLPGALQWFLSQSQHCERLEGALQQQRQRQPRQRLPSALLKPFWLLQQRLRQYCRSSPTPTAAKYRQRLQRPPLQHHRRLNTASGHTALKANTTGDNNTAYGTGALKANTHGL